MSTKKVKQIKETKLKYLSEKENVYGTNNFFQVLDITLLIELQELIELGKTMKIPIWEYNGKYYLKINAVKVKEVADMLRKDALQIETGFKEYLPYSMDLTFSKYDVQKNGEQITGYSISESNKTY